jgi:hypothetical protein
MFSNRKRTGSRQFYAAFESLETRQMMSFTAVPTLSGSLMIGSGASDVLMIDKFSNPSGGFVLRHNRFGIDPGFASPYDFNTSAPGEQLLTDSATTSLDIVCHGTGVERIYLGRADGTSPVSAFSQLRSYINVKSDDGNDYLILNDTNNTGAGMALTLTSGLATRAATGTGTDQYTEFATMGHVSVFGGSYSNTYDIRGANIPVDILAGFGDDVANIGTDSLDAITAPISFGGEYGNDQLIVHDCGFTMLGLPAGNFRSDSYTVTSTSIARTAAPGGPAFGGISFGTVENVTLDASHGANSITVSATDVGVTTNIIGESGNDQITVGTGSFDTLLGPVYVDGSSGNDTVTLNDSAFAYADTYTIDTPSAGLTQVTRPVFGFAGVSSRSCDVTLRAQDGNNAITVNNTYSPVTVEALGGDDRVFVNQTRSAAPVHVISGAGDHDDVTAGDTSGSGVNAEVIFDQPERLGTLSIALGGKVSVPGNTSFLYMHRVNNDAGGTLDLYKNDAMIDPEIADPFVLARTTNQVIHGRDGGSWTGYGLTSSAAALNAGSSHRTALALVGGSDYLALGVGATFHGRTVNPGAVVIKYTYEGDANLDGAVNVADLGILATNWQRPGGWSRGDFNYDGTINVADLGMLSTNWQAS